MNPKIEEILTQIVTWNQWQQTEDWVLVSSQNMEFYALILMFQDESYGSNREQLWKNDYWSGVFNSKEMFTSVQNGELTEFLLTDPNMWTYC